MSANYNYCALKVSLKYKKAIVNDKINLKKKQFVSKSKIIFTIEYLFEEISHLRLSKQKKRNEKIKRHKSNLANEHKTSRLSKIIQKFKNYIKKLVMFYFSQ